MYRYIYIYKIFLIAQIDSKIQECGSWMTYDEYDDLIASVQQVNLIDNMLTDIDELCEAILAKRIRS